MAAESKFDKAAVDYPFLLTKFCLVRVKNI